MERIMERILVTGGNGLLAHHLKEIAPRDCKLFFLDHVDFDVVRPELMEKKIAELRPTIVINTAAYNLVEKCEQERELSWAINATAPEILAKKCAARPLQHRLRFRRRKKFTLRRNEFAESVEPLRRGKTCRRMRRARGFTKKSHAAHKLGFRLAPNANEIICPFGLAFCARRREFEGNGRPDFRPNFCGRPRALYD
jgi:hypothetical protein